MMGLQKNAKEKKITFFFKILFIHFEMHMERQDKSENIFGI